MAFVVSKYMILRSVRVLEEGYECFNPKTSLAYLSTQGVGCPLRECRLHSWLRRWLVGLRASRGSEPSVLIENVRGKTPNNGGRRTEGESEVPFHPSSLGVESVCLGKNKGGDDVDLRTKTPPKKRDVPRLLKHQCQCHLCKFSLSPFVPARCVHCLPPIVRFAYEKGWEPKLEAASRTWASACLTPQQILLYLRLREIALRRVSQALKKDPQIPHKPE